MAYTVKELATVSGVTVRTLHFYDEVGLLKPAYCAGNGYRYYEEKELLTLQQILFFRELGFELKQAKRILNRSDFDKHAALASHRLVLMKSLARTRELIKTVAQRSGREPNCLCPSSADIPPRTACRSQPLSAKLTSPLKKGTWLN